MRFITTCMYSRRKIFNRPLNEIEDRKHWITMPLIVEPVGKICIWLGNTSEPIIRTFLLCFILSRFYHQFVCNIFMWFICHFSRSTSLALWLYSKMWATWIWALIALRSRAIVIEIFWHLDTRVNISFLSFVNCVFIHGIIIFLFSRTIFHALDGMPGKLKIWSM